MIKFFRGPKTSYNVREHGEGIYFATDTKEVLMEARPYTGPKKPKCKQQWLDVRETIEEAFTQGGMVTLLEDIELSQPFEVKPGVEAVLDLNGHEIKNVNPATMNTIIVSSGAHLTIKGNGTIDGGSGAACNMAVYISGGHCVIEDGTFKVGADKDGSWNSCIEVKGGSLEINGGHFSTEVAHPQIGKYFVLNKKDGVPSEISVTGGTFVNFNPAASVENPEHNYVANGYKAVQIDGTNNYKVVAV